MHRLFRKTKKTETNLNHIPNVQDSINSLPIPPSSQAFHQPQQQSQGDPTIAQDQIQVDTTMSTPCDQMKAIVPGGPGPSSSFPVYSMTASTLAAQEHMHMQEDFVQALLPQRRRGCIFSIGQDHDLNKVCNFLGDDEVRMIGIYGMGGVGKTTLMKEICKEFFEPLSFKVIWVVVSKSLDINNTQKVIMEELNLSFDQDEQSYRRAEKISRSLSEKKVALLFDDIWGPLDLEELGIPHPNLCASICKIIFATRSEKVCNQMQPDREIKVECLGWDDSWALFEKSVGKKTIESHYRIPCIAQEVAKECKGLPLALKVIGRAMTCKYTPEEWENALITLQKSPSEFLDVEKKMFECLKLSYDALPDRGEKKCFLYCCLYPEDWKMDLDELVNFWIVEGFLAVNDSYIEARNRGYDVIGTLQVACLLERSKYGWVKMHDVIRDMGLWIASELKLNYFIHGDLQLTKTQVANRWQESNKIFVMRRAEWVEQPFCPNLSTLSFQYYHDFHFKILNCFFKSMPNLRVLELDGVYFDDLPVGIGQLQELRYLKIYDTNLKTLPTEIGDLSKLEVLYLKNNPFEELPKSIGQLVELKKLTIITDVTGIPIGNLSKLEILTHSGYRYSNWGHVDFINCIRRLSHSLRFLDIRCIPDTSEDALHGLLPTLQNMDKLSQLRIVRVDLKEFSLLTSSCLSSLTELRLFRCSKLDKIQVGQTCLQNLRQLVINSCRSVKRIVGLQHLKGLVELTIGNCDELEDVITVDEVKEGRICFPNLKVMTLGWGLNNLKSICSDGVLFSSLTHFKISGGVSKLKKLPRGLMNEKRTLKDVKILGRQEWWDTLSWQDDDFKFFLLPHFKVWK